MRGLISAAQKGEGPSCPCCSGNPYSLCCQPFHLGQCPSSALQLMRSRYAAYALGMPAYIIRTTHPGSMQYLHDEEQWSKEIMTSYFQTHFLDLTILDVQEKGQVATVAFYAHLRQKGQDISFTERSFFEHFQGKWLYWSGQVAQGFVPSMATRCELTLLPLAYYGDPVLKASADVISSITKDTRSLAEEMIATMEACQGQGLCAPQVHHSVRLCVMCALKERGGGTIEKEGVKVCLNPEISSPSLDTWTASENCVSIPSVCAPVTRPKAVTVTYTDLDGHRIQERVAGWQARILLHENDHMNGILFIDHLKKGERDRLQPSLDALLDRLGSRP